jgi:hypothetical protein
MKTIVITIVRTILILQVIILVTWFASRPVHAETVRDRKQVYKFRSTHPCPATGRLHGGCPGYVVDHIQPLACNGPDRPFNMQWQTIAEGKAKDRWELNCKLYK